jgi:ATP-dependent DNA ligase
MLYAFDLLELDGEDLCSRPLGDRELDAMDPNVLRHCVEREINKLIEPVAWDRCEVVNKAEVESLRTVLENWGN